MKVLVILGHPRKDSYCAALADEYIRGAKDAGTEVKSLLLADMQFEMNVVVPSPQHQHLETDIIKAKELILWSDHLVFIYPTWWGNMPALLKAFLDRTIMPGFAFRELQFDSFDKLLSPRTGQLITTMDTPLFVYKLFNGAPGTKAMIHSTLNFCGVQPVRKMHLSPIKHSTPEKKEKWLRDVYQKGRNLENGVLTWSEKIWKKISPWIKAVRLQFYPMAFFAYSIGAFAASNFHFGFDLLVFLLGYLLLFLLEVIVVYSNEYHDKETDELNHHYSPFTGGSRVLVSGLISGSALKKAIRYLLILSLFITGIVVFLSSAPLIISSLMIFGFFAIAMSYTAPPLKLSYNGMGEIVVGFTHSFALVLCGFVFQGGNIDHIYPWLLSFPLFLSIIPSIIMAGIPDYFADKQAGKRTLSVRFGRTRVTYLACIFVFFSSLSAIMLKEFGFLADAYGNIIYLTFIHALLLVKMLYKYARKKEKPNRIDGILVISLLYIMWFALIPFIRLM